MTRALCKEVGRRGIRVNALAPGIIETDQTSELDDAGRRATPASPRSTGSAAEEIADVALFLASTTRASSPG